MKIIAILVTAGLLGFMGWVMIISSEAAVYQHNSESFPHVTGIVDSSQVTATHTSRGGTRYHVHIRYFYSVGNANYVGYRYRYDDHPSDIGSANAIVAAHQPGSAVKVYYNPLNPGDAVLSIGMDAGDAALPFFIGGLNLFLLSVFAPGLRQWFLGRHPFAGGVKIISETMVTRVRLPRFEPLMPALWTSAGLSGLAAVLTLTNVLHPPWQAAQWSLMILLSGGAAVYWMQYLKIRSGRQDLVIDEAGRTMQLPLTYKRRKQMQVSFSDVSSVLLKKVRHSSRSGSYYTYLVTLKLKNNAQEKLVDLRLNRAKAFAAWLKEKIGLAVSTPEED